VQASLAFTDSAGRIRIMSCVRDLKDLVKSLAREAGFARVGVAPADPVPRSEDFRKWIGCGYHGDMEYMKRNLSKRVSPVRLVPGARSVISLAVSYAPDKESTPSESLIARYARGRDYHRVLKRRCHRLMDRIREVDGEFEGRAFVDSAPVMERSLAALAGLGWIGKNGCLVVPGLGSYVVLCEIICNLPLEPDAPVGSQCYDCAKCVEACPTSAFVADASLDARRCVSYLTIEHRGQIDPKLRELMGIRIFGCDRCQEVCPFNQDVPAGDAELVGQSPPLGGAGLRDILTWDPEDWDTATRGSATRRANYDMFLRNAVIAAANSANYSLIPILELLSSRLPQIRDLIQWALHRIQE